VGARSIDARLLIARLLIFARCFFREQAMPRNMMRQSSPSMFVTRDAPPDMPSIQRLLCVRMLPRYEAGKMFLQKTAIRGCACAALPARFRDAAAMRLSFVYADAPRSSLEPFSMPQPHEPYVHGRHANMRLPLFSRRHLRLRELMR